MNINNCQNVWRAKTRLAAALFALALAAGCAQVQTANPADPWESYNRSMFAFNDAVDGAVLKPIAQGYEYITPQPVRTCISNIFSNVGDVFSSLHSFLQGRAHDGINSIGRVLMNTTLGLGGCIDVASMNNVPRIPNDMGITLGVWGLEPGPYLVLPFMGPSTVRDTAGEGITWAATLGNDDIFLSTSGGIFQIDNIPLRNSIFALYTIDTRASLLKAEDMVDSIALDRYSFIRDAYLQRREAQVKGQFGNQAPADDALPNYEDDE